MLSQRNSSFWLESVIDTGHPSWDSKQCYRYTTHIIPLLSHISNPSSDLGRLPAKMKLAKVIAISKKGDHHSFTNDCLFYGTFLEYWEKLSTRELPHFLPKHKILSTKQCGMRQNKSAELALLKQEELVLENFQNKDVNICIYVYFSRSFDTLNHSLAKLDHCGIWVIACHSYNHAYQFVISLLHWITCSTYQKKDSSG